MTDAAAKTAPAPPDSDYCKLSFYLHSTLRACGVNVLQDSMLDYAQFDSQPQDTKDALVQLVSGKTCSVESLSYKVLFLDSQNATKLLSAVSKAESTYLPLDKALTLLELDTLLFGGMMEVTPTHVLICNEQWVRDYYVEPLQRLQEGIDLPSDDKGIQALFARSNTDQERAQGMARMNGMMEQMQGMIEAKKRAHASQEVDQFQSFSGEGNSLGVASSTAASSEGRFDPTTLPDAPPASQQPATNMTSIAVRLLNGKRQVVKLPVTQTVGDLAAHLKASVEGPFRIAGGFPPKPLTDPNMTVEEAGLKGAQVSLQKAD